VARSVVFAPTGCKPEEPQKEVDTTVRDASWLLSCPTEIQTNDSEDHFRTKELTTGLPSCGGMVLCPMEEMHVCIRISSRIKTSIFHVDGLGHY